MANVAMTRNIVGSSEQVGRPESPISLGPQLLAKSQKGRRGVNLPMPLCQEVLRWQSAIDDPQGLLTLLFKGSFKTHQQASPSSLEPFKEAPLHMQDQQMCGKMVGHQVQREAQMPSEVAMNAFMKLTMTCTA